MLMTHKGRRVVKHHSTYIFIFKDNLFLHLGVKIHNLASIKNCPGMQLKVDQISSRTYSVPVEYLFKGFYKSNYCFH